MKWLRKILLFPLLLINVVMAVALIACAYSQLLPPEHIRLLSLGGLAFPFVLAANVAFLLVWLVFYPRYMLASLVACLMCIAQIRTFLPVNFSRQEPPEGSIKVVSYNLLSWTLNIPSPLKENPTVQYLDSIDADIVCLQEFAFANLKENGRHSNILAKYPYRSFDLSGSGEWTSRYLGCLSKYPILSVEQIDLYTTANGCQKYRILHEEDTIVVYNCHLQSNNLNTEDKSNYEQILSDPKGKLRAQGTWTILDKLTDAAVKRAVHARILMDDMEREDAPYVILCGDFNDSPISYTHHLFSSRLTDAFVASGNGPGISYNRNKLYYRIDHMMHSSSLDAYACRVDRTFGRSDHYPVSCYLKKSK